MDEISKQLREAIDVWGEPIFLLNASLDCVYANMAFCQLLGLDSESCASFPIKTYWPAVQDFNWAQKEFVSELINVTGRQLLVKISIIECSNKHRLCRILCASSKDENMINFHAQRLETLGMLAGGVAHDFNNILTGILGHITYLKTILPMSGSHVESLTAIEDGARRASTVTQEILNFSRLEVSDRSVPVELGALINRTCTLLRGAISPRFEMEWHVTEKKLFALVEESKMAQILINLAINSRDAIAPGG
ncbi:MAG: PAS domain-containing protein, partial [SAR324 cluster bacterium]|nr:PAS domain-containing protein [SAR324 cluster bacterium]